MTLHSPARTSVPANLRDVGGLRTSDGHTIRTGVLYRGDAPRPGDPRSAHRIGLDPTSPWPPATVIDLRSDGEVEPTHPLADASVVHRVPLGASLAPDTVPADERGLHWAYRTLAADAGAATGRIVELVAHAPGPILVHCAAGKDRTGIVVATLLAALDVPRDRIVADYLRAGDDLDALWARLRAAGVPEPAHDALLGVDATALEAVLDDLADHPGGVPGHLVATGTDADDLRALAARLVTPRPV